MRTRLFCVLTLLATMACDGTDDPTALDEPLVVQQADFKRGALPFTQAAAGAPAPTPTITSLAAAFGVLRPGTRGAGITGRASKDAYSVGVRFADLGSGYWVHPVGGEDPLIPDELNWSFALDAASDITPGKHDLEVVTFDKDGNAGGKQALSLCIASDLPDNLNVCDPKVAPPLVIASLTWNTDADLDLTVVAPDGTAFNRTKRSLLRGGTVLARLDNDGVSGCLADGRRRESFVWLEAAQLGSWNVFVNLFDACEHPAVDFVLTTYQRVANPDGTFALLPLNESKVTGTLTRAQANGGAKSPLFVSEIKF
jgi:hypothetical protein